MAARPLLVLEDLRKTYGSTEVLKGVNLEIADGEFLTVVGPSGSGKTTILRMIGGFLRPSSGDIRLEDSSIIDTPINARPFNTVFQDYALFPHMSVADNVAYGLKVRRLPRNQIEEEVSRTLALVDMKAFEDRFPSQLSGGQQQRVALARAIICRPRLVLLDEPLGALDAELRRRMQSFLKELQRTIKTTFLFITHDQEEAITMADRICVMRAGQMVQIGTPRDVYYRPSDEYVARFFGDNNIVDGRLGDAGEMYRTIETSMGTFHCTLDGLPSVVAAATGQAASMVVRPEAIQPVFDNHTMENCIDVKIEDISFAGPSSHISVRSVADPKKLLTLKITSGAQAQKFRIGDVIGVGWFTTDCFAILTG